MNALFALEDEYQDDVTELGEYSIEREREDLHIAIVTTYLVILALATVSGTIGNFLVIGAVFVEKVYFTGAL